MVWALLAGVAALFSVAKPLLGLPKRIKKYEAVLTGYRTLFNDLDEIRVSVSQSGKYGPKEREEFKKARDRRNDLSLKEPESKPQRALIKTLEEQVKREYPEAKFIIPEVI